MKKIYSSKINIWNESALYTDETALLHIALPAKCRSVCGCCTSFLSGRVLQKVHPNLSVGNSLSTLEHHRNSMYKSFKVHIMAMFSSYRGFFKRSIQSLCKAKYEAIIINILVIIDQLIQFLSYLCMYNIYYINMPTHPFIQIFSRSTSGEKTGFSKS